MKVYRIVVIAVAIILGLFFAITILFTPNIQATIKEPVTEEYYDMLKENIVNVAKTLDKTVVSDETLTADFYFTQNELVVTVSSFKASLTGRIPISAPLVNVDNGKIIFNGIAEFENVEYVVQKELQPIRYIVMAVMGGIFLSGMLYILFYEAWFAKKTK